MPRTVYAILITLLLLLTACAIEQYPGVVERNGPVPEFQRTMLADGVVTEAEMAQAHLAVIDCMSDLDLEGLTIVSSAPHWSPDEGSTLEWQLVTSAPPGVDGDALAIARDELVENCSRQHIWFISAAWLDQLNFGKFKPVDM